MQLCIKKSLILFSGGSSNSQRKLHCKDYPTSVFLNTVTSAVSSKWRQKELQGTVDVLSSLSWKCDLEEKIF